MTRPVRTASQVTNQRLESGDLRIDGSGDRRARLAGHRASREGHLTHVRPEMRVPATESNCTKNVTTFSGAAYAPIEFSGQAIEECAHGRSPDKAPPIVAAIIDC
jgi:hypothetical protein